jgi:hypothetical protein
MTRLVDSDLDPGTARRAAYLFAGEPSSSH